ncbi:MAG: tail fiber domain-containing protein [Verrucomicrobiota bacterium]
MKDFMNPQRASIKMKIQINSLFLFVLFATAPVLRGASATPPDLMSYQGYLVDVNGAPLAPNQPANYPIVFRIYDASAAGNILWAEQQIVTVDKGNFSVVLGEGSAVSGEARPTLSAAFAGANASDRYLGITVTISGTTMTISPRLRLLPSPYAFTATAASSLINNSGQTLFSFGNGRLEGSADISVTGSVTSSGSIAGLIFANRQGESSWQWYSDNGTARLWNGADRLAMTGDGKLGIGTTTPRAKLEVDGNVIVKGAGGGNDWANQRLLWGGDGTGYALTFASINNAGTINTPTLTLLDNGNVGVGTTAPGTKLQVSGNGGILSLEGNGHAFIQWFPKGGSAGRKGWMGWGGDTDTNMNFVNQAGNIVLYGGNVGIGTTTPAATLHINGSARIEGNNVFEFGGGLTKEVSAGKIGYETFAPGALDIVGVGTTFPGRNVRIWDRLGIGTSSPIVPLHVGRADGATAPGTRKTGRDLAYGIYLGGDGAVFYNGGADGGIGNNETIAYGGVAALFEGDVVVVRHVWSGNAIEFSDGRAKKVFGASDPTRDLNLLRDLKVRDFKWIDRSVDNHRVNKKLIAQEVEQVFPQAVFSVPQSTAIPNVYQVAEKLEFHAERKELRLTVSKPHDFKIGDSVDLHTDNAPMKNVKVTGVSGEREFTVSCDHAPKSVFVYGKYVNDFLSVDYDAIAMLNVSATQELARQVDALKKSEARFSELEEKTARLAELEQKAGRVDSLEREVAELKKLVAELASAARKSPVPVAASSQDGASLALNP